MGTFIDESGFLAAGRALRGARMSAGQTLEQVSRALSIRVLYLEALERGEFGRVLGPTYAESMIVRYAVHLGLDAEALLTGAAKPHVGPGDMGARGTEPGTSAGKIPETAPGTAPGTVPGPASATPAGVRPISPTGPAAGAPPVAAPSSAPSSVPAPAVVPKAPVPTPKSAPTPDFFSPTPRGEKHSPTPTASRSALDVPRRSRRGSGGSTTARRGGSRLLRVAVLGVLVIGLVAVTFFGASELGLFSIFDGDSVGTADSSSTTAVSETGDTTPTTDGSVTPSTSAPTSTTTLMASTTTTEAQAAVPFSLTVKAKEDVWVEFRDAVSGEALHVGMIAKDESVTLSAEGSVNAVVGKPGALTLQIDGRSVQPPNSFRWLVTSTGVEDRP
ncbi:MAG TPA: RodZ domain-containing protein [Thermoleophilia bacterium]|nr:RodZ domain-containing protein [Thermoleophilia bacterium]